MLNNVEMFFMNKVMLLLGLVLFQISGFAQDPWKLEKDKNGIKVWTRKTEKSNLKEFRAVSIINSNVDKVVNLFRKTQSYEKWTYKIEPGSTKCLKKVSDNEFYLYEIFAAPLIKKRDIINHIKINNPDASGVITINMDATPDFLSEKEDFVRIRKMKAFFIITPLGKDKVQVEHQAYSSPGGNIPDFMTNMGAIDAPYYLFEQLKAMVAAL